MKLITTVLIVRLFLQLISKKKDKEDNSNDVKMQKIIMHPAEHQLR